MSNFESAAQIQKLSQTVDKLTKENAYLKSEIREFVRMINERNQIIKEFSESCH